MDAWQTFTLPYIESNPEMYTEIAAKWKEITAPHLINPLSLNSQCSADFQPFPSKIGAESQKRGGNALGISGHDPDRFLLEFQCSWALPSDDPILLEMSRSITAWLEEKLPEWLANAALGDPYLPWLMNDAMGDQNVTGKYKDYAKLKSLQEEIDPQRLFDTRAGGYKY